MKNIKSTFFVLDSSSYFITMYMKTQTIGEKMNRWKEKEYYINKDKKHTKYLRNQFKDD